MDVVSKNRNKMVECLVCGKVMRSDNLAKHTKTHKDLLSLSDDELKEELRVRHADEVKRTERAAKRQQIEEIVKENGLMFPKELAPEKTFDMEALRKEMVEGDKIYGAKIEFGSMIARIIDEDNIREESLSKEKQEALFLFRRQQSQLDISDVELRPWQQDAMKYFESPTERKVIWIRGNNGNEGKSWFQNYVQTFFGFHRVCRLDLRIKHANVCNVLKKRSLGTIDIFLFNDSRSVSGEELNLYRILEDIKDGQATTSKYDNDNIRFKTPNTVMILSNNYPDLKKLSRDRWIILDPKEDGLKERSK